MNENSAASQRPLLTLIDLAHRARHAEDVSVLRFMAVNDTHALATYRQAGLWFEAGGVIALSGLVQVENNTPYVVWLSKVCKEFSRKLSGVTAVTFVDLPEDLGDEWKDWLPQYGLWLPVPSDNYGYAVTTSGGLILVRDVPWSEQERALLVEWIDIWRHAWLSKKRAGLGLLQQIFSSRSYSPESKKSWWKTRLARSAIIIALLCVIPVRLTVLAPAELVSSNPAVIRAALDGVVDAFHVEPNQIVKKGDLLFVFDEAIIMSRLEVARQAMATAEAEYRQVAQQALTDSRSKALLSSLTGKIEEKRSEMFYLEEQLQRSRVVSPQDGIALFDEPSEWIGRPVVIGERIMRIALPDDVEIEAWIPLGDAIPLENNANISLHLNATPLDPVRARLRYMAHEAVSRPDGSYAYRLRAELTEKTRHRVGLKGTARINGRWVPMIYWVMRRPFASIRVLIGW